VQQLTNYSGVSRVWQELLHNVNLLVDLCESGLYGLDKRVKQEEARIKVSQGEALTLADANSSDTTGERQILCFGLSASECTKLRAFTTPTGLPCIPLVTRFTPARCSWPAGSEQTAGGA
jgi:hypothetical protein